MRDDELPGGDDEVDRIVDAAWDVLTRSGYDALKVELVARLAGVSVGTFYRHFGGKRELMAAILRQELARATKILDELTSAGSPEERVRTWIDAVVSLAYGRRAGPRARWIVTLPAEIRELVLQDVTPDMDTSRSLRLAIADGVDAGVFPAAEPHTDALLIQGLCSRLDQQQQPQLGQRSEAVARVADFVLAALSNPARQDSS